MSGLTVLDKRGSLCAEPNFISQERKLGRKSTLFATQPKPIQVLGR
jgi:hypothetical protein